MNKFIIMGRLSTDPEVRYSPDGKPITQEEEDRTDEILREIIAAI